MSTSETVVFLVTLPPGVYVEGDVLGASWPVAGTPADCHLVIPNQPPPPSDPSHLWGGLTAPSGDLIAAAATAFARDDARFWGDLYDYDSTRPVPFSGHLYRAVAVTHYDGRPDEEAERAFCRDTIDVLERWIESFTQWLEVLAMIDVGPGLTTSWQTPKYVTTHPIRVTNLGELSSFTGVKGTLYASAGCPRASLIHWTSAVSHANAGDSPPSEHLFLRDARAALRRNELRRAVIDAGTASEVALSKAIRQQLTDANRDVDAIDQILRTLSGVIELYDLYSVLGPAVWVSRRRLMDQVASNVTTQPTPASSQPQKPHAGASPLQRNSWRRSLLSPRAPK